MHAKKHLSFSPLIHSFATLLKKLSDPRKGKVEHSLHDIVMGAFACMYMQSPSLLRHQKILKRRKDRNNLETLFKLKTTPAESTIRDNLNKVSSENIAGIFKNYLGKLQRSNYLKSYQFIDNKYLVTLDGSDYFSSKKINCSQCLQQPHKDGSITHSHKIVQPALLNPDKKQVFPLMPEEVKSTDGSTKQDCEINASKRLIPKIRKAHPKLPFIWLADSLYATTPMIDDILEHCEDYIFSAKRGDHKTLYKNLAECEYQRKDISNPKGKRCLYEWANSHQSSIDFKCRLFAVFCF